MNLEQAEGLIAELALSARSAAEYRRELLNTILSVVGAEVGAVCGAVGTHIVATEPPSYGCGLLEKMLPQCLQEFSAATFARAARPRTQRDTEFQSKKDRERSPLYRDYLRPLGVCDYAMRYWLDGGRVNWVTVAPTGTMSRSRFYSRAVSGIDRLFPVLSLSARLHPPRPRYRDDGVTVGNPVATWATERGLTTAERNLLPLVERGFTNPEIASFLGLSPNTVRNRLASLFRKVEVTRRAELVFVVNSARTETSEANQA